MEIQQPQRETMAEKAEKLRHAKAQYNQFVLCGQEDPYAPFIKNREIKAIAGPKGSNLLAMVRIKNSGPKARRYRLDANRILFEDQTLQQQIVENLLVLEDRLVVHKLKNPSIVKADGTVVKFCWHHSPNHILTISLISADIHKRNLHVDGKGGRRYEVPDLRRTV